MRYKTMNIQLSNNSATGNHVEGLTSSGQNIVMNLAPASALFGKGKKLTILDNQPIFAELLMLFTNVQADQKGVKTIFPKNADGTPNPAFPEELAFVDGGVDVTVDFPEGVAYTRTYTSNVLNSQNQVIHKIGEEICDESGQPIVCTSITVFCVRIPDPEDPTGFAYPMGKPQDLASRFLRNGYKRVSLVREDTATVTFDPTQEQGATVPPVPPVAG